MFRSRSTPTLVIIASCLLLAATLSLARTAHAESRDVVDLEGDTHHNPPASTTDTSTKAPAVTTDSDKTTAKGTTREKDSARQEADAEKLKLRAGERVGNSPRGKAQVLGMALQEGTHQRVKVVDVAMNSPAFDAGVMKGDEIMAFQGFRGESYREWIDGIRRLTADTGAGLKIPVVVARDGKQATVLIEVQAKPVPRTLAQPGSPLVPPGVGPALPAPGAPATAISGGNNVFIDNGGTFGAFFAGGEAASPNERAVAHIVRIGAQRAPNPAPAPAGARPRPSDTVPGGENQATAANSSAVPTAAPINGGARIGMAGFRDDPAGMVVMVDVGALPPGNYTVGITDPSIIGGATVTGTGAVNPNVQTPPQAPAPVAKPAGGVSPTGAGAATPNVNPANNTPPNQASVNNNQQVPAAQDATVAAQSDRSAATLIQIGTITVDQSGTGRMQQRVENVQVRNVVGKAIVLYSHNGSPTTLPANLNGTAAAAARQGVSDTVPAAGSQTATNATAGQAAQAAAAPPNPSARLATPGSQVPVAAGIIQLVTDRRPPPATAPQTTQAPVNPTGVPEQPAVATPPAGQNLVR